VRRGVLMVEIGAKRGKHFDPARSRWVPSSHG
jgi:hypothetical protein